MKIRWRGLPGMGAACGLGVACVGLVGCGSAPSAVSPMVNPSYSYRQALPNVNTATLWLPTAQSPGQGPRYAMSLPPLPAAPGFEPLR